MVEPEPCGFQGCKEPSVASLERRFLCREHFLLACYGQLDACARLLTQRPFPARGSSLVRQSATECISKASALASAVQTLTDVDRARLCDIVLWATELSRRFRRSPRRIVSIPVRLRSEKPSDAWEEDACTQIVSRYGAALECEHLVQIGETLLLVRKDTGERTRSRVVFRSAHQSGRQEIGVELLDCENFWGLDWEAIKSSV